MTDIPTQSLPPVPPASEIAARADAQPRRTTGILVLIAVVLLVVAALLRGGWAFVTIPLAVLVLATAYGLALRRVWAEANRRRV